MTFSSSSVYLRNSSSSAVKTKPCWPDSFLIPELIFLRFVSALIVSYYFDLRDYKDGEVFLFEAAFFAELILF